MSKSRQLLPANNWTPPWISLEAGIGHLLFWESGVDGGSKTIGADKKQAVPHRLIVDGQQRLTSLYAVVKGKPVVRENWEPEFINIAFSPLEEKFSAADAAVRRDKAYIENISEIWDEKTRLYKFTEQFLTELRGTRDLSEEEVGKIHESIDRLRNLLSFPLSNS